MKRFLQWLQQYNKAFTALLGVPLIYYLAANLVTVVDLPFTAGQIDQAVLWLIAVAVGGAVWAMPNKKL